MAQRQPPTLPVPAQFADAVSACMAAKPLQHQDELTALLTLTQQLHPPLDLRVIVEIGSFRGGTIELWARVAREMVVSIDLPDPAFYGSGWDETAMQARNAAFAAQFPHVHGILGDSHDIRTRNQLDRLLDGRWVDLLFIDGDHTLAGVTADYEMYSGFVRRGGVIAFHDTLWCDPARVQHEQFGVPQFFDSLPGVKFQFHAGGYWGGIGALVVT